jgi:predicted methyltransferase
MSVIDTNRSEIEMRQCLLISALMMTAAPAVAQHQDHAGHAAAPSAALAAAIRAPTRTPANLARDKYRHPAETLAFFGVAPDDTVIEVIPGGGWYTEILAPYLKDKGALILAQPPGKGREGLSARFAADAATYGKVKWTGLGAEDVAPGSVDVVLTFRNVHNLIMRGGTTADDLFAGYFKALKPGGVLGIVDHRLPEARDSALEKTSGYLKTSTVVALAQKAGFKLAGQSEINANPKDTANWAEGVWSLPPTLKQGEVDKEKYLAIAESDRMTLKFVKPQ